MAIRICHGQPPRSLLPWCGFRIQTRRFSCVAVTKWLVRLRIDTGVNNFDVFNIQ